MYYLLLFHCNNGYMNMSQCCIICTLPVSVFFNWQKESFVQYAESDFGIRSPQEGRFCDGSANMTVDILRLNSSVGSGSWWGCQGVLAGLALGGVYEVMA
jgi:hypothetical protein